MYVPVCYTVLANKKMNMKRIAILCTLLLVFATNKTKAQFITNLVVSPTPPATLTQWAGRKEILGFLVIVQGGSNPRAVLIKTEIKLTDGTVVATTDLSKARQFTFRAGNTPLDATDVLPLENMIFNGKFKSALARTGKLLSDNYQICVQLVEPVTFAPVSEIKCRNFFIASLQLPVLIKPFSEEVLDVTVAQTAITFRWTPPVPKPTTPVRYRIQVFEVMEHQNPVQAMRSNQPLLDKEVVGITQYIWQPQGMVTCCLGDQGDLDGDGGERIKVDSPRAARPDLATERKRPGKYVWTVQSTEINGTPLGDGNINGDGRSEPIVFFVNRLTPKTGKEVDKLKEEVKKPTKQE
jgi:hypothetical protein